MRELKRAKITAVGHFLPDDRLTNHDLEQMVETNDEWIQSRTGIKERRILKDEDKATSYMGIQAAEEALEQRGIGAEEIDVIIVGTVTPDYLFPATACLIQKAIGAKNAYAFDLSAACSGFLFSLTTGTNMIESGRAEKVLVIGADKMSSIVNFEDRSTCILFGDGAGAVLLEQSNDESGIIDFVNHSDGDVDRMLYQPAGGSLNPASADTVKDRLHFVHQDGRAVFKRATVGMANVTEEIMERNNLTSEDIDWLVPHQANKRIIDVTANRVGLPHEKVMLNIQKYGNTTSGTIPLCLYDWREQLNFGDNLIITSFGGGLTWGAMYLKWGIK